MMLIAANNPSAWTGPTGKNTYLLPGRVPALIEARVGIRIIWRCCGSAQ